MGLGGTVGFSRVLVVAATLLLSFDGAALLILGLWRSQIAVAIVGGVLLVAAFVTVLSWRSQQRRLVAIQREQQALRAELREIDSFIGRR